MSGNKQVRRAHHWRELVSVYLSTYVSTARVHAPATTASARIMEGLAGDVDGIPDFAILTTAAATARPAEALAEAEQSAKSTGRKYGVVIMARPGRGIAESYSVMSTETLAKLLREREHLLVTQVKP